MFEHLNTSYLNKIQILIQSIIPLHANDLVFSDTYTRDSPLGCLIKIEWEDTSNITQVHTHKQHKPNGDTKKYIYITLFAYIRCLTSRQLNTGLFTHYDIRDGKITGLCGSSRRRLIVVQCRVSMWAFSGVRCRIKCRSLMTFAFGAAGRRGFYGCRTHVLRKISFSEA